MDRENAPVQKSTAPTTKDEPEAGARGAGGHGLPAGYIQYYGLQRKESGGVALTEGQVHRAAEAGVSSGGGSLPYLSQIQASFGHHDVTGVQSHQGGAADRANSAIGSEAYATGNHVAFKGTPSLHTAAHEAAHVVQQRGGVSLKGGIGQVGDAYEQHADAVADRVVQGKGAGDLLDTMAPSGARASGGGGGVQGKLVQLDIKSDLRDAMSGWGSGEDKIFARIARASSQEITAVVNDAALMEELRKDLSKSAMERLVDQMDAPLPYKLRLAMRGWGNDNDYIMRSLQNASTAQLQLVLNDAALMQQLMSDLGRDTAMQVMQRLNAPLKDKLKAAMKGWGRDESFMFQSLTAASLAEVVAVAQDRTIQGEIDSEMSAADGNRFRAQMARRIFIEGGAAQAEWAFFILQGLTVDDKKLLARLALFGSLEEQRRLCDAVIVNFTDRDRVRQAFKAYWNVEMTAQDGATMQQWPIPVLKEMHQQLKALPSQDTRAGVWKQLSLSNQSKIDAATGQDVGLRNRAAYGDGNFIVGTQASPGGNSSVYGISTPLTANSAVDATTIAVAEGPRLRKDENIRVGENAQEDKTKITNIAGNTLTVTPKLAKAHYVGEKVQPDDVTADKGGSWLSATVRHEIAHAVDAGQRSIVSQFQSGLGGWWTGEDIESWIAAMADPWKTSDGSKISGDDQTKIKDAIKSAVKNPNGSLAPKNAYGLADDHPLKKNIGLNVPVINAAEICLRNGDGFFAQGPNLHRSNGKVFTVSWWYKKFMYCNEVVLNDRENDYTLYAPTEFFAETYTTFYEEAGQPNITDEMLVAAATAIADVVHPDELNPSFIVPSVFDPAVAPARTFTPTRKRLLDLQYANATYWRGFA